MKSIFLFLLLFITISARSQLQKNTGDIFLRQNTDTNISSCDKCNFYTIVLKSGTPDSIIKRISLIAIRKIEDRIYIVDSGEFSKSSFANKNYDKHFLKNNNWKLSPVAMELKNNSAKKVNNYRFTIAVRDTKFISNITDIDPGIQKQILIFPSQQLLSVFSSYKKIEKLFLDRDEVISIDVNLKSPKEELAFQGFDLSANKINTVHGNYPAMNGAGQHVSIKENFYDTTDVDLHGRLENSPLASKIITNHANFIATIIAGAGNSIYYAKGAAWGASISSSSFELVLPDADSYYKHYNITVQNHSYGTDIDNTYGINAVAFDKSANNDPDLLHVFSSGNSGTSASAAGVYSGITGFANLTGNFKMAKNVMLVGAVDSFGNAEPLSSKGPAYDGRIKPEIVAFQKNGTSESAALVSGTALLLQQYYKSRNNISLPSALAKAIIINTADDINTPGPDYATGFGNLNAIKAMDLITGNTILSGVAVQGRTQIFPLSIPPNIARLKVTLTWNDTAASAFAPAALINDLDLSVVNISTGFSWKPWVLSSYPNKDSLNALPVRKRDSLNNEEQVTIDNPLQGNYQVRVNGFSLAAGPQKYFAVYTMDTANIFRWYRPVKGDFLEGGKSGLLRWENTYSQNGNIEFSYASTNSWNPVASNVDLNKRFFEWITPDTIAPVIFRMKIGSTFIYSDTFLITKLLSPKAGYVCDDKILVYWEKLPDISKYLVYILGDKYMEPYQQVSDTSIVINRNVLLNNYIAVSPILNSGIIAPKSYAFDYTLQGAGCYINAFLADGNNNTANLTLSLGTTLGVDSISFEKLSGGGFVTIYGIK
ncbi:MAG: S8 family serine peptidase, partial [Chitinophagaceae bacterium]|nr:S8 family serine peptidase [Chitinophagaceae bacterium]